MKTKAINKTISAVCVLALSAAVLAGCGLGSGASPTGTAATTVTATYTFATTRRIPTYRLDECDPVNEDYDLSTYKVFDGNIGGALQTEPDDAMLKEFAEKVADEVIMTDDISCEVKCQGFSFAIVKIGNFWEWQRRTGVEDQGYNPDSSVYYCYREYYGGEETAGPSVCFDVYKDLSGHFIVVTQCRDYKIVHDFFARAEKGSV